MKTFLPLVGLMLILSTTGSLGAAEQELKNVSVSGGLQDGKARLVIEGWLNGGGGAEKVIFSAGVEDLIQVTPEKLTQEMIVTLDILEGSPRELALKLKGDGEIRSVQGPNLLDWSIRKDSAGERMLVLRPKTTEKPLTQLKVNLSAETPVRLDGKELSPVTLGTEHKGLLSGFVRINASPELLVKPAKAEGVFPVDTGLLPDRLKAGLSPLDDSVLSYRVQGDYALTLTISLSDPEARAVVLRNLRLSGRIQDNIASFTLNATARVKNPNGANLKLLSGNVGLIAVKPQSGWRVGLDKGAYVLIFDREGDFPIEVKFNAAVQETADKSGSWRTVQFQVAASPLQPVELTGLSPDTQFDFAGGARPERVGDAFKSFLPSDGNLHLSWKTAAQEGGGKLFFAVEMTSQITFSPGLMRQAAILNARVMQGELNSLVLNLKGDGEVTRVQGEQVLAWNIEPTQKPGERRLLVRFNQPQKDQFSILLQVQTPLGAFPLAVDAMQITPESATRFAGYLRIVNAGAVRLEVSQAHGLSQISPEQFPDSDLIRAALPLTGSQRFAYRFSTANFAIRIQADQILPELSVSELLAYRMGENESSIDAEFEVDIREAPLRELLLLIPRDYAIAGLNAPGSSDYFVSELSDGSGSELRAVYAQPVTGRQVLSLRLERNQALGAASWNLPRVQVQKAKSMRGHLAVSMDAGLRASAQRTQGLTEIATAFFPKKTAGIQAAFRISDPAWQATMAIERLPQTVQVDAMHLFSIGEGIAYGSSVLNYLISGAPASSFKVDLSSEYFNVEFSGKDIRSWQKTDTGYIVQLHTPVAGSYTLLATYERPFRAQGETLTFTGARPLDAQTDQGHTLVISAYQFQVKTAAASPGLLPLEPGEVPAEYRLFFDAPILAAYRYSARPFDLKLTLSPLAQGDSLSQVVDRALLTTHVSKEGQLLTDARYFVKNRGHTHFRVTLPAGVELWSATVDGTPVVPVTDNKANLIPIPQRADPNAVLTLDLKLAARSSKSARVLIEAPIVQAPVLLSEWKLEPDAGQRLVFRKGSQEPVGARDVSGFFELVLAFLAEGTWLSISLLLVSVITLLVMLLLVRWTLENARYRFSFRFLVGVLLASACFGISVAVLIRFGLSASSHSWPGPRVLTFLVPVQQAANGSYVEVSNLAEGTTLGDVAAYAWPVLLALGLWFYGFIATDRPSKTAAWILGWGVILWAALRMPHGGLPFIVGVVLFLILNVALPAARALWRMPRRPQAEPPTIPGGAAAGTALLAILCVLLGSNAVATAAGADQAGTTKRAATGALAKASVLEPALAESVAQEISINESFVTGTVKIQWNARKGQRLPLLFEPAVLTRAEFPATDLKLLHSKEGGRACQQAYAEKDGDYTLTLSYQLPVTRKEIESGFVNPVQYGLINRLSVTIANSDVDIVASQAVSLEREGVSSNTVARLVLLPVNDAWIAWKPRSRDVRSEKAVYYAEISHLFAPAAGVVEGSHFLAIRPARGELHDLVLKIPEGSTITDVTDWAPPAKAQEAQQNLRAGAVSLWRFDPDTRTLRIALSPPQSRPFGVVVRSQVAVGALPFETSVGLPVMEGAATQLGSVGVATGNEVQLDLVSTELLSPINLEDFPGQPATALQATVPGLTVRRAFRYSEQGARLTLKAAAVEPDVRVESQDTLSLGEDRVVLASKATVSITRAGIFKLSFSMPAGFDVDTISGAALSHWTEMRKDGDRIITLHLNGKTEGQQEFAVSLAGPGVKSTNAWVVPQVVLREATKQRGSLLLVPEQGMRLQPVVREGVTQLDPQKSGITQKGVLAFRILQTPWNLSVQVERVDPWIQVTSLQHALLSEAQMKITANLQYQIENTGLKQFRVYLPTNAENVKFQGDQVADFAAVPGTQTNALQLWEVKLHRAVLGGYRLQATFTVLLPDQAKQATLQGIQSAEVNLQRGFVTVQSKGRLQVRIDSPPEALQPAEWQSIPVSLRAELDSAPANFSFRLVEPSFSLPLVLDRHQAAKLLPARVNKIDFTSVVTDEGVMLTKTRMEIFPGDKRLLEMTLPKDSTFWFAFVNQSGVWPWRDQERILVPLEKQSRGMAAIAVEIFYTSRVGSRAGGRSLTADMVAPKFDLPLENITWQVCVSDHWRISRWAGSLQMEREQGSVRLPSLDVNSYLQTEQLSNQERTKEAENLLNFANNALQQGDPQEARRAFQAAYGLSTHDAAFNEDARVQLHNVKIQQALIGLNMRQATVAGDSAGAAGKLQQMRSRGEVAYSQKDAKDILDNVAAEDNAAFTRLAERIVQQQDASVTRPAGIRANIPQQGRMLVFKRAVLVDPWADLRLQLTAKPADSVGIGNRLLTLCGTLALLAVLALPLRTLAQRVTHVKK